ncbi:hypothetical protein BBK36DRAFT_1010527 [Trichoderma citrinoviride]|uniref:Uncharacterized protein n=1 Tax=Trichoderma citrinoviride TaxID=58853 RepID=A0A2T4B425_9HYPO|nr:hypothetical protein BBK36DRAFT_1010527 [Trichoderma citrinoviride]PTB64065.1 hypothetical protein BBK36DRAFT_1010527 [Trichoderma citrinoviride]
MSCIRATTGPHGQQVVIGEHSNWCSASKLPCALDRPLPHTHSSFPLLSLAACHCVLSLSFWAICNWVWALGLSQRPRGGPRGQGKRRLPYSQYRMRQKL